VRAAVPRSGTALELHDVRHVQTDLEADRKVATILADLIVGGLLVTGVDGQAN
jgi:hypothetical protein